MLFVLLLASLAGLADPTPAPVPVNNHAKLVMTTTVAGTVRPLIELAKSADDKYILAPAASAEVLAKFPDEDPNEVSILEYANAVVNATIEYKSDPDQYGMEDMWVMDPVSMKGDCEDIALTKFSVLSRSGYPTLAQSRILAATITENGTSNGHAVLEVRMASGTIAILDSRYDHLMTKEELIKTEHYTIYDWG